MIQLGAGLAPGSLTADRNITVRILGGYNAGFTAATGMTGIKQMVVLRQGKTIMQNVRITP